jgi:hypothetical protein
MNKPQEQIYQKPYVLQCKQCQTTYNATAQTGLGLSISFCKKCPPKEKEEGLSDNKTKQKDKNLNSEEKKDRTTNA